MIDVFISHHTKTCLKITQAVCHSLEQRGIKVWYAPRDTTDAYANSIVKVINECKVFILILNKESSQSFDCLNEINLAVERLRKREEFHLIPFQISSEEISEDAKYYLGRLHWLDAITPPLELRIKELTDKIAFILNKNKHQENNLLNTPILNNINFIGREKELKKLENILKENNIVFLKGIGGIGKSEIVKKYANIHINDYDIIIFAKYIDDLKQLIISDNNFIIKDFIRITSESEEEYFKRKLKKIKELLCSKKSLIIIDNFDCENDAHLEDILSINSDIIFTTRNDFSYLNLPILEINTMDNIYELFKKYYPIEKNLKEYHKDILKIINLVSSHSLAVELIAKYMYNFRKKPLEVYESLINNDLSSLEGNVNHLFENMTISSYINNLFSISKLSEDEINILINLSLFGINGIDFDIFINLLNLSSSFLVDKLIKSSFIMYDLNNDIIYMHPLIIDSINNRVTLDKIKVLFDNLSKIDSWKILTKERIKYESLVINIYKRFEIEDNYLDNFINVAKFLRDLGYYDYASNLLLKILAKQENIYGKYSIEVAKTYDLLRFVNNKCYKTKEAIKYNEEAIKILRKIKTDDYLLADYLKSRAYSYIKDNEPLEAKKILDEVFNIYYKILDKDHYKIGNANIALSRVYYLLKDYDKALKCGKEALRILSLKYPKESNDYVTALMAVGSAECMLGNYTEGIEELKETVKVRKLLFHQYDFSTIDAYEHLAVGYICAKDYQSALKILKNIQNIFEGKLSKEDRWYKRIEDMIDKIKYQAN